MYNDVLNIYKRFDKAIASFQSATGLLCPSGCSTCCIEGDVEATVLEVLPLAMEIYSRKEEDAILSAILERQNAEDSLCVLFKNPLNHDDAGPCGYYEFRPLVCRLFGFASRKNKSCEIEFMTCRIIKEQFPDDVKKAENAISKGYKLPVFQDSFMKISSMKPGTGTRRLPINEAIKEAIESLYWLQQSETGE
jgi:uncharacterized protein